VVSDRTAAPAVPDVRRYDVQRLRLGAVERHRLVAAVALAERADVLHAHFGHTAFAVWRAARRLRRPFTVSLHGWDLLVAAAQDPGIVEAVSAAAAVVVPSQFLAAAAVDRGIPAESVRVLPCGVDLAAMPWRERRLPQPGDALTVTFAGRFVPKKGVLDAALAVAQLAAERPVRARFVGFGPLEDALRRVLDEHRVPATVVDGRAGGAVRSALVGTDVAIVASRTAPDGDAESLGLVAIEAQACGVPLVCVAHGGLVEAVSPDAAVFVDEGADVAGELATALRRLADEPERWASMGAAGRAHVARRFELGARAADHDLLWQAVASGRPAPQPASRPGEPDLSASVVLVTHNRRRTVAATLDALDRQTHPPAEVVVVDNASDDGTADDLAARAAAAPAPYPLRVLTVPAPIPVAAARNRAVGMATGAVVAFTDDDCRPRSTWLEALVASFAPEVDLVQGRTVADPAQPLRPLSRTQWTPAESGLYETANVAYRRATLLDLGPPPAGPFDLDLAAAMERVLPRRLAGHPFGEDTELGWRARRSGARSRFAVHAVVDHEVSPPSFRLLVRRSAAAAGFPLLVRRVPELAGAVLTGRVLLSRHRLRWWLAVGAAVGAGVGAQWWPALLALPYAADLLPPRSLLRRGGRRARLAAVPVFVLRDMLETVALLRGSWLARRPVL
jgi:glycosyltransferase involved in cell wall biosynthesis/GT2 family glycosyltransferase